METSVRNNLEDYPPDINTLNKSSFKSQSSYFSNAYAQGERL